MGLDERTSEDLKRWLRKARVYLGAFVAGGSLVFAYTYYPLHGAKVREIEHLEQRLRQESLRLSEFERNFSTMQAQIESQPDGEAFDELQEQLAVAMTRQREFEQKLARSDREAKDLERSRGSWKVKYTKLEQSRNDLAHALMVANANLNAAEKRAKVGREALDSSPSPKGNSAAGAYGNDRGPSLASADSGSHPRSSNSALEGTPAKAN